MSNLDKLLKKLAGNAEDTPEAPEHVQTGHVDPVYVEKLASAVEYLLTTDLITKEADLGKVKALMAQGMGAEEAIKKAYPDWSDEQVAALVQKLSGGTKEGPKEEAKEESEKAASFASDRLRSLLAERRSGSTKTAGADPTQETQEFDFTNKVKSALKEKIAAGAGSKAEGDFEFINSVLKKLQTLAASSEDKTEEAQKSTSANTSAEATASKEASVEDEVDTTVEEVVTAPKESEMSANPKLTLAEMLKEATSEKAASESTQVKGAETANKRKSDSLTDMLRNSILQKASTPVEV